MTNKEFSKKLLSRIIDNTYDADDFHNMMVNIFGESEYLEIVNDWMSILFGELCNSAEKALREELERIVDENAGVAGNISDEIMLASGFRPVRSEKI
jgi:hypothetical protein